MQISIQEAAVLVTVLGVGVGYMSYRLTKRKNEDDELGRTTQEIKDAERDAREEGARRKQLEGLHEDVDRIKTVEIPRIGRLDILTEGNAVAIRGLADNAKRTSEQIQSLAELETKRSASLERLVDHLIDQHAALGGKP